MVTTSGRTSYSWPPLKAWSWGIWSTLLGCRKARWDHAYNLSSTQYLAGDTLVLLTRKPSTSSTPIQTLAVLHDTPQILPPPGSLSCLHPHALFPFPELWQHSPRASLIVAVDPFVPSTIYSKGGYGFQSSLIISSLRPRTVSCTSFLYPMT